MRIVAPLLCALAAGCNPQVAPALDPPQPSPDLAAPDATVDARAPDLSAPDQGQPDAGPDAAADASLPGPDGDRDGLPDDRDPCPAWPDSGRDTDGDGLGDACDADDDGDGLADWADPCPWRRGDCPDDVDGDGRLADADPCPLDPDDRCASVLKGYPAAQVTSGLAVAGEAVWASTAGGLLRATGEGVTWWGVGERPGLPSLDALDVTPEGTTWAAGPLGVMAVRPDGVVVVHPPPPGSAQVRVDAVLGDPDGAWLAAGGRLLRLDVDGWRVEALPGVDGAVVDLARWTGSPVVATTRALARLLPEGPLPLPLPDDLGQLTGLDAAEDDELWVFGRAAVVALGPAGPRAGAGRRFEATGGARLARGERVVASAGGLIQVDRDGRFFPATPLGRWPAARAARRGPAGLLWAGGPSGVHRMDGFFAAWRPADGLPVPCVHDVRPVGNALWLGTDRGLLRLLPDGTFRGSDAPHGEAVLAIGPVVEGRVFVGTGPGMAVYDRDGTLLSPTLDDLPPGAVRDVALAADGGIWGATDAGLVRLGPEGPQVYRAAAERGLPDDALRGLATDGDRLWIATAGGLARWDAGQGQFGAVRPLPDPDVRGVAAADGQVYASTPAGVWVGDGEAPWTLWARGSGALPAEAPADAARTVVAREDTLWWWLEAAEAWPDGALARRPADEPGPASLVRPARTQLGLSPPERVRLRAHGDALWIASCNPERGDGGFAVLRGDGRRDQPLAAVGVPGRPADQPTLIPLDGGAVGWATEELGEPALRRLPDGRDLPLAEDVRARRCGVDGQARRWCVGLDGDLVVWVDGEPSALPLGQARDVATDAGGAWVVTDRALVRYVDPGQPPLAEPPPGPDPRAVAVDRRGQLQVLTATALHGPGAPRPLPRGFEPTWGGLAFVGATAVVVGDGGALQITERVQALPDVASPAFGVAATPAGVAIGDAAGVWIAAGDEARRLTLQDGLPGVAALQVLWHGGALWVRGEAGAVQVGD